MASWIGPKHLETVVVDAHCSSLFKSLGYCPFPDHSNVQEPSHAAVLHMMSLQPACSPSSAHTHGCLKVEDGWGQVSLLQFIHSLLEGILCLFVWVLLCKLVPWLLTSGRLHNKVATNFLCQVKGKLMFFKHTECHGVKQNKLKC